MQTQEPDVFIQKIHARPINGKYLLDHKLGEGGFGMVLLGMVRFHRTLHTLTDIGRDNTTGEEVALKLEHRSVDPSILQGEVERCKQFQGLLGFPTVYWYGWHDDYKVMAFELLGPSLEDLFVFCDYLFSLKTVFMLLDQLLQRLESLHSRGILHRDLKPQNFLMGTGANGNVVYVTDFGLAEDANPNDDWPGTSTVRSRLIGTARYASIKGHEGRVQSYKDDLESLGYNMVYFARGELPWQGLKGPRKEKAALVMETKKSTTTEDLCAGLPEAFVVFMRYVRQLEHGEMPDYAWIRALFRQHAEKEGWKDDNVFDWTVLLFQQQENANERVAQAQR